ncbi:MAG: carboxypeptidase-like regulatory domain-containing protein, partial [Schleiferiaceae bacterium]
MRQITLFLALFGFSAGLFAQSVTVSGTVTEASTGESLPSVVVSLQTDGKTYSANTNAYGFYSLSVPAGKSAEVKVQLIGYADFSQKLGSLTSARKVDISLKESATQLQEVDVVSERLNTN